MGEMAAAIGGLLQAVNIAGKALNKFKARKVARQESLDALWQSLHEMIATVEAAKPDYDKDEREKAESVLQHAYLCEAEVKKWTCPPSRAKQRQREVTEIHLVFVKTMSKAAHERNHPGNAGGAGNNANTPHNGAGSPPEPAPEVPVEDKASPQGPPKTTPRNKIVERRIRKCSNVMEEVIFEAEWETGEVFSYQGSDLLLQCIWCSALIGICKMRDRDRPTVSSSTKVLYHATAGETSLAATIEGEPIVDCLLTSATVTRTSLVEP
ncbi:hypothetical protein PENSPDRAFT_668762 [Peniophora sp. CONT]|nr:hypothetical protein PENSPDRAFT_668762 [Peniophora sp. CONT]